MTLARRWVDVDPTTFLSGDYLINGVTGFNGPLTVNTVSSIVNTIGIAGTFERFTAYPMHVAPVSVFLTDSTGSSHEFIFSLAQSEVFEPPLLGMAVLSVVLIAFKSGRRHARC